MARLSLSFSAPPFYSGSSGQLRHGFFTGRAEVPMILTKRQRITLEFYRRHRYEPPNFWHVLRASWAEYLVRFLLVIAALWLFGTGYQAAGLMVLCFVLGIQ